MMQTFWLLHICIVRAAVFGAVMGYLPLSSAQEKKTTQVDAAIAKAKTLAAQLRPIEEQCDAYAREGRYTEASHACRAALSILDQISKLDLPASWREYAKKQRDEVDRFMSAFNPQTLTSLP